jgi:hypothetical protein
MKTIELVKDMTDTDAKTGTPVRVLLPTGEVYDVVGVEFEADNQHGDVLYLRTELHEHE